MLSFYSFLISFIAFLEEEKHHKIHGALILWSGLLPVERIHGNWPGEIPTVHRWAYDYSKPGMDEDYVPQTTPLKEGEEEGH